LNDAGVYDGDCLDSSGEFGALGVVFEVVDCRVVDAVPYFQLSQFTPQVLFFSCLCLCLEVPLGWCYLVFVLEPGVLDLVLKCSGCTERHSYKCNESSIL